MIDYEYSDLFTKGSAEKQLIISYGYNEATGQFVHEITNERIHYEQFTLSEGICSQSELTFGGCEAASIEFRVTSEVEGLKGKWLLISIVLDNHYENPFTIGYYKVESDKLTADKKHRNITAYDAMYYLVNTEVSDWYNGLIFPFTLGHFRNKLFEHLGVSQVKTELPNDGAIIYSNVVYDELFAGDLLRDICAINGCFGHINRDGWFEYLFLTAGEPVCTITKSNYEKNGLEYEDYVTEKIDSVDLFQNGAKTYLHYETYGNRYTMRLNALYLGENIDTLTGIVNNIFGYISAIQYVPFSVKTVGNPCIECGDRIKIISDNAEIYTYILERKLTGIQDLKDTYTAEGVQNYESTNTAGSRYSSETNGKFADLYRQMLASYTFSNVEKYILTQKEETEIIQFNLSVISETDAIFIATIPVIMDSDGEIILNYYIDEVRQEKDEVRQYLHAGNNFVTVSNYFNMGENSRMILSVKAKTEYIESIERQNTAKILAFERYFETGAYNEPYIDKTPPKGEIRLLGVKAVIFAKGLNRGSEWDGTIAVSEEFTPIKTDNKVIIVNMAEAVNVDTQTPLLDDSVIIENLAPIKIENNIKIIDCEENIYTETEDAENA